MRPQKSIFVIAIVSLLLASCSKEDIDISLKTLPNRDMMLVFEQDGAEVDICINGVGVYHYEDPQIRNFETIYGDYLPVDSCKKSMKFIKDGEIYSFSGGKIDTTVHQYIAFSIYAQSGENGYSKIYKFDAQQGRYLETSYDQP